MTFNISKNRKDCTQLYCVFNHDDCKYHYKDNYDNIDDVATVSSSIRGKHEVTMIANYHICGEVVFHNDEFFTIEHVNSHRSTHCFKLDEDLIRDVIFYTSAYQSTVFYFHIDAIVLLRCNDVTTKITIDDYEDPYTENEMYEGTFENILNLPRVLHVNDETYVRMLISGFCTIFSTHKILCHTN